MSVTIDGYLIDAALTEGHKYSATVTKYPIESGSSIADNITKDPLQVTIEGVVSDTPLGNAVQARQAAQTSPDTTFEFLPSDDALARLIAIFDAEEPVTIETSLKRFENMVLIDLDVPRDADTGDALHFTATFEQVTIVTNNRTTVRVASPNNAKKKKASKPPLVNAYGKAQTITTADGKILVWNDKKGRYERGESYDNQGRLLSTAQPNGVPASVFDVDNATQKHNSDLAKGIISPSNGTYYDYSRGEWMNQAGGPATQQNLTQVGANTPWWK